MPWISWNCGISVASLRSNLESWLPTVDRVFAFGAAPPVAADQTISAEVTYLGGPTGGEFQLLRLFADPANDADEPGTTIGDDDRPDPV